VIREINRTKMWDAPAVTELAPLTEFYKAEEYHQNYFRNNPQQPYCQVIISPKVTKFRKNYFDRLKKIEVETI
jgi:peptide-methionine (S)-S-oxide reductase